MASIPNNYEIDVSKDKKYFCRIQLPDTFETTAKQKLETLKELFGDEYELEMTFWECRGIPIK